MEQVNEAIVTPAETESPQKKSRKGLVAVCLIAALLIGGYLGFCYWVEQDARIWSGVCVLGEELGGMTVEQAAARLDARLPELAVDVYLYDAAAGEESREAAPAAAVRLVEELGVEIDALSLAKNADWVSRSGSFFTAGWRYFNHGGVCYGGSAEEIAADELAVAATAARLAKELSFDAVDSGYALTEQSVDVTVAKDGRAVSAPRLAELLTPRGTWEFDLTVSMPYEVLPAKVLTAQEIYDELAGEMKNAAYDSETDTITADQIGVSFDAAAAQKLLDAAQPGETVEIAAQVEYPTVTAKELKAVLFRDVLGECRTHVSGTAARINNVKLSASTINEYVMNSGEVFSYNEAVGQRTAANGYQPAPAYIQGETVDEIGGGICQTSSTLYLACLRGDLEITERYAHRYVPAYIPWGMDATVSWGGPDYKFTNNTDYPIKIVTEYEKNYLTVKILGTNVDGRYAQVTNEVLSTTPWTTVYEEDPTMAPGAPEKEKTSPYTGYKVRTYHTIYDADGKVIDSHYEATSDYKVRNKVILRAPAVVPAVPEVPAAGTAEIPVVTPETPVEPEVPAEPAVPPVGQDVPPGTEPETPEGAL